MSDSENIIETETPEPACEEAGESERLVGRWQAAALSVGGQRRRVPKKMDLVMHFRPGGLLELSCLQDGCEHHRFGTYRVNGERVTVTLDGHTEEMAFRVRAFRLYLKKRRTPKEVLYLTRLAA
jgi:hypothetical protein